MPESSAPEIPTVAYYLVLLVPDEGHAAAAEYEAAHVAFIETMEAAKVVLLGGGFEALVDGAEGAYLLHVGSQAEAEAWAARDPLVQHRVYRPRIVAWHLVGISRGAIAAAFSD